MLTSLFAKNKAPFHKLFTYLDEIEKSLTKTTVNYILNGDNPAIIAKLSGLTPEQVVDAGLIFRASYAYAGAVSDEVMRRISECDNTVLEIIYSEILLNSEIAGRFGLVVAALLRNRLWVHFSYEKIPHWVIGFTQIMGHVDEKKFRKNGEWPEYFTGDWFLKTLVVNEAEMVVAMAILLERTYEYAKTAQIAQHLMYTANWQPLIDRPEFTTWLNALDISAKVTLTGALEKLCDVNNNLQLVTRLLTDKNKKVREKAERLVSVVDISAFQKYALQTYDALETNQRKVLAALLVLRGDDKTANEIKARAEVEKSKSVKEAISVALMNRSASTESTRSVEIPEVEQLPEAPAIPEAFIALLNLEVDKERENASMGAQEEIEHNKLNGRKATWQQELFNALKLVKLKDVQHTVRFINGEDVPANSNVLRVLMLSSLMSHDALYLSHIIRVHKSGVHKSSHGHLTLRGGFLASWLRTHPNYLTDLRQFIPLLAGVNLSTRTIAEWYLREYWAADESIPEYENLAIWPFFAEHAEYLEEAFGLRPIEAGGYQEFKPAQGMHVLKHFPSMPEKYLQVLYKHALSPSKSLGPLAREVIEHHGVAVNRIISALKSSKQEERIVAAEWLGKLQAKDAIPMLKQVVVKESRETVKAALLSALHDLGERVDEFLAPAVLLSEAESGLQKALPKGLENFPFGSVPQLRWGHYSAVDPTIIKWWIVLAFKLKQPEGNPLFLLYLKQLDSKSRQVLGRFLFDVFIATDTQNPSDEQASQYAQQNQQQTYDRYQRWAQYEWGEEYASKTLEDAYNSLYRQKKAEYLTSAISLKGILCLAAEIPAAEGVEVLNRYMKDHYTRRHQIEALLTSFALNNDPAAIQLLLSIARRHRTNSVQEKAKTLVSEIAQRNGWSSNELADRTIPSAGFELSGVQQLEYGSRVISVRLTADLKSQIENENGKIIKALPTARQDDDAEKVKDAKKQFALTKKELKQVVELQTARLHEAMCIGRDWPFSEWNEYLYQHPIMTHLVQRLVWEVSFEDKTVSFRPTAERELIDCEDDVLSPPVTAIVRLAHASTLEVETAKVWVKLLKEEKVKPLFDQFTLPAHALSTNEKASTKLSYHNGWVTDTFSVRGVLTKLGYKRGAAEDGGHFSYYYKTFGSLGLAAVIEFSGNVLPEELLPAVLYHVAFTPENKLGWESDGSHKRIDEVPASLVMEVMKDYEAVAAKGSFDENWQAKSPW